MLSENQQVPYAPDLTPGTLGKVVGEHRVLRWLLDMVSSPCAKGDVLDRIADEGLAHVPRPKDRRDMASHVLQGMRGYGLVRDDGDFVVLTDVGAELRSAPDELRDVLFARHILTRCNGHRLLDEIRKRTLRGEEPGLEDLALELDRHATSKSISTMRAWLARAGIFPSAKRYRIDESAVARVLGLDVERLVGLERDEIEFVLAARLLALETGVDERRASEVADVAEARASDVRYRRKSLDRFVRKLEARGVVARSSAAGRGGSGNTIKLVTHAAELADDQLRGLLAQSEAGFPLNELRPLSETLASLASGLAVERGIAGEMLAVHLCLLLGLRVRAWRNRAPQAEIDLTAERTTSLTYQRWVVQVKNTDGPLDSDRVDREIGAVAGTAVTHVLFIVPRAELTEPARMEILTRARLTPLHIYFLGGETLSAGVDATTLLRSLQAQLELLTIAKREEALRRESA